MTLENIDVGEYIINQRLLNNQKRESPSTEQSLESRINTILQIRISEQSDTRINRFWQISI